MIVARCLDAAGQPLLMLGLTAENVRRLKLGQPIDVPRKSLDACGLTELRIGIMYGETIEAIAEELGASNAQRAI